MSNGKKRLCAAGYAFVQITHKSEVYDSGLPRQAYKFFCPSKPNPPQPYHSANKGWLLNPQASTFSGHTFPQSLAQSAHRASAEWSDSGAGVQAGVAFVVFLLLQYQLKRREDPSLTPAWTLKQGMENAAASCILLSVSMYQGTVWGNAQNPMRRVWFPFYRWENQDSGN